MGMKERKPIYLLESPLLESVYKKYRSKIPHDEMKASSINLKIKAFSLFTFIK